MNELGPIFRALMRQKTGAILIALQIALTLAIMVNAIYMMQQRSAQMDRPSGLDEANIFYLSNTVFGENYPFETALQRDLDLIRRQPGVVDATQINAIPMSNGGWSMGLKTKPDLAENGIGVAVYMVDDHGANTMGLELIAGEHFKSTDIEWRDNATNAWPAKTLVTQAMAEALFPGKWQSAVGQTVYINDDEPIQITGILKTLQAPWNGWDGVERSMLVPYQMEARNSRYLIRTASGQRDQLMPIIEKVLAESDKSRIIRRVTSMADTREKSYLQHNAMNRILLIVVVVLTLITGFGIVGLAMFSINRRTRQIGTRRALGATRWQVMQYFLLENLLISSLGVAIGCIGAVGLNIWLVSKFTMAPMSGGLVLMGALVLYLVGQLAVLYPARRASLIEPATATRSV